MKLGIRLLAVAAALLAVIPSAKATDLVFSTGAYFIPGPRLIDGTDLNVMVDAINGMNDGSVAGTYTGTFNSLTYPSNGLFIGIGSSAARMAMGTTADRAIAKFYGDATNATGYARGIDSRLYFGGAGGGEAVRAYGIVNNVTAAVGETVNGIHASLSITGASGAISGAAHAARNTLEIGTGATPGGTIDVIQLDTVLEGTVPATAAYISTDNLGTNKLNYLFRITNASTTMFADAGTGAGSCALAGGMIAAKVLKVSVGGTDYWLPLCSSNS